jgi:hypothetical protein
MTEPVESTLLETHERFRTGIVTLATHPARIQERLLAAFEDSLRLIRPEMLPQEAGTLWTQVWQRATARYSAAEGILAPSFKSLRDDQAMTVAGLILAVGAAVERQLITVGILPRP